MYIATCTVFTYRMCINFCWPWLIYFVDTQFFQVSHFDIPGCWPLHTYHTYPLMSKS